MRDLWIIPRDDVELYEYFTTHFAGRPDVEVILDRRQGERRQRAAPSPAERRRAERRRHSVEADLAALGVAIVTVP
jgi:hypothetical protein